MRVLFDQGSPVPLRDALTGHTVSTAYEMGWERMKNGELLAAAEASFDCLVTTDQNLRYQQNIVGRHLAILVLFTTSWPKIRARLPEIVNAVDALRPGDFVELDFWSPIPR
ncbi:MAG: hypothetical protein HY899_00175 [Deltaproteobacteria bacterium]|nr:hypothetical protein [Deltaproteobacteria bacterium]